MGPGTCADCGVYSGKTICLGRFGGTRLCVGCIKEREAFASWLERVTPRFAFFREMVRRGYYSG